MGEWSDYFEDYPEEDMANYRNGVFDPELVKNPVVYQKVC